MLECESRKDRPMPNFKQLREEASQLLLNKLSTANWDNLVNWLESDNLDTVLISKSAQFTNIYQLRKQIAVDISLFVQAIYDKNYVEICNKYTDLIFEINVHDKRTIDDDKQVFREPPKDFNLKRLIKPYDVLRAYADGYRDVNNRSTDIMCESDILYKTLSSIAKESAKLVECDNLLDKLMILKRLECIQYFGLWNLVGGLTIEDLGGLV